MNENEVPEITETKYPKRRRNTIIIAVVAAVLLCCCVAVIALLAVDPFGWGVFSLLFSKSDAVVQAMPEDTSIYMGVDFTKSTPQKIDRILSPFSDAIEDLSDEEIATLDDLRDQFSEMLDDELDLSLEDDILPWVGKYAAVGLYDVEFDEYGDIEEPKFVVAIQVRNKKEADAFLPKLEDVISDDMGYDFDIDEYDGVDIYELDSDYEDERFAFARSKDLLLFGLSKDSIEDAIDAQNGASLADDDVYKDLAKKLPKDRSLTFFMPGDQLKDITSASLMSSFYMFGMGGDVLDVYDSILGVAFSASITDDGLQFDTLAAYDMDELSDAQLEMMKSSGGKGKTADMFPDDTFFYVQGAGLDLIWEYYRDLIVDFAGTEDYDEMMDELEDEIGFNIEDDLIPYLNGEFALAAFESRDGMIAADEELNIGMGMLVEVSDEDAVLSVVDDFVDTIEDQGAEVDDMSSDGATMYDVIDDYNNESMVAFGLHKDFLGIMTSGSDLEDLYFGDSPLSKNDGFKQVWKAFPGGVDPSFYVDVQALVDIIRDGLSGYALDDFEETAPIFEPIEYIAAGGSDLDGNIVHSVLIIFIIP